MAGFLENLGIAVMMVLVWGALIVGVFILLYAIFPEERPTRRRAEYLARGELMSKAKEGGIKIAEMDVIGYEEFQLSPAEKVEGVRAAVGIALQYAYKYPDQTNWSDGSISYLLTNNHGQWQLQIMEGSRYDPPYNGCRSPKTHPSS